MSDRPIDPSEWTSGNHALDPVELLGSLPAPEGWGEVTDLDTDLRAAALLDEIISADVVPITVARGRRRRHLRLVTGIIAAVAVGGAAVAALTGGEPTEKRAVSCWSAAVSPPEAQVHVGWDGSTDPVDVCVGAWSGGDLGDSGPPDDLQTCVNENGVAAVLPGPSDACARVGLAQFTRIGDSSATGGSGQVEGAVAPAPVTIADADRRLNEIYNEVTCTSEHDAVVGVVEVMEDLGYRGWSSKIAGAFSVNEPCATAALDPTTNTILVVPVARAG